MVGVGQGQLVGRSSLSAAVRRVTRNPVDCSRGKGHSMCQGGIGLKWYNLGNYHQFYVGGMSSVRVKSEEGVKGDREPVVEGHARLL